MPSRTVERPLRALAMAVALGLVGGLAAWLAIVSDDGSVRPWLVIALAVTGCVLGALLVFPLAWHRTGGAGIQPAPSKPSVPSDRERGGLESYERRVAKAMQDPGRFEYVLRRQLCDLAEHRLQTHFGVDSRTDPDRAHHIVGDELWQLMTTPTRTIPTAPELESWVRILEAL